MTAYAVSPAEEPIFLAHCDALGIQLTMTSEKPSLGNLHLTQGADCLNVLSDVALTAEMWDGYARNGVRLAVTRTIGMEHMNLPYAEKLGIHVRNITYSPASVADYAIMLMLMVLRNVKPALARYLGQDYTMDRLRGRELPNLRVGLLGAGPIAQTTARHLSGFGCPVGYWNRSPKAAMEPWAAYQDLDTLLAESDIVSLHLAACPETFHFLDREKLGKMKPGAVLINTARGTLVDSQALIDALESGQISAAGLDVLDGDRDIYYRDHKNQMVPHHEMAILNAMPNVLLLPHMAYCTDQALEDMVVNSMIVAKEVLG
jgi:D-lactate dehydrogenase